MVTFLNGKKTYLIAIAIALLNLAVAAGWINPSNLNAINMVLGALGLGALRSGVAQVQAKMNA